ncbi:MAG: hypothetical protein F7C07_00985 [Desulfurococcales archaeon]|nr:hypothetical protein [Desulfurococcales archaeon]
MSTEVRLKEYRREGELYTALMEVSYKGARYELQVGKLVRKPSTVRQKTEGDYILVELLDEKGDGISTCCIHVSHLEKGCVECPSLLRPAG